MAPEERFNRNFRQFFSRRDFPPPPSSYRDRRTEFYIKETIPAPTWRYREVRVCRNFPSESIRARIRYSGESRVEKKFDHELQRDRFRPEVHDGGKIRSEKKLDPASEIPKKARLCEIDENLLPLKKRKRFDVEFYSEFKSRPPLLPPFLPELEEGEIAEGCLMIPPPLVEATKKEEIFRETESISVKVEATIQIRKTIFQNTKSHIHCQTAAAAIPKEGDPIRKIGKLSDYKFLSKINEGTFGIVHKAIEEKSGKIVALKQMKMERGGRRLPQAAIREIKLLFSLNHPSILKVSEVVRAEGNSDFFLAMEFMEQDLFQFLRFKPQSLSTAEVKGLMLQLLEGVSYLHWNNILHRDLKTANLLLNKEGKLKICDFGLACRERKDGRPLTSLVVTIWYRAPELLLGTTHYSKECIMAELLKKDAIFKGKSEIDQLHCIAKVLGTPTTKNSPGLSSLPSFSNVSFMRQPENLLRQKFPVLSDVGLDLLKRLLSYDPKKQISAEAAKNHAWFQEFPLPKGLKV